MSGNVGTALMLTSLGALGTALGGLVVVIQPKMEFKRLGCLQGLAAGLMLSISMFDLFPSSVEEIGFAAANIWFFFGVIFFAAIVAFVPEPSPEFLKVDMSDFCSPSDKTAAEKQLIKDDAKQGDSLIDAATTSFSRNAASVPVKRAGKKAASGPVSPSQDSSDTGSQILHPSGTFSEKSLEGRDSTSSGGVRASLEGAVAAAAGHDVPQPSDAPGSSAEKTSLAVNKAELLKRQRVLMSGLVTALGISLHNFPEGVAVFLASVKSPAVGASLAFAIALHNVPEGVAVALPVFFASGSRMKGFLYAFVSGLAEPLAVVILAVFFPNNVDKNVVEALLAAVAGVMAFLALHELVPLSIEHAGRHAAVLCLFAGMALMSLNLYLLDHWFAHEH